MRARATRGFAAMCCLALVGTLPATAQPQDTMPETLRRLLDIIPTPRLSETLGLPRPGVIAMDGEGSVRVRPDAARIRIGLTNEGVSATEVAQQNASRMSAVVDAIKKVAGEPALTSGLVEVRTDAVTLTPVYAHEQPAPRGRPGVSSYRARNTVRVSVRDLEQRGPGFLGSMIEEANKAGANEISGPEFLVHNDAKPKVEARVNAIEDARIKAETYARALNARLGRVLTVTEADGAGRPTPMMARAAAPSAAPPIEAGTNEIAARVSVTWELKQD